MFFYISFVFIFARVCFAETEWDFLCDGLLPYTKIPHPLDCKKYIQCMDGGEAFLGECAIGTAYDKILQNCLPESVVDCSHLSTTFEPTETTVETSTGTTSSPIESDWDYLCEDLPVNTVIPHPYDCKKFFQCNENGEALPGKCREDQAFDKDMLFCLPEEMVDCSHIITTIGPSTSSEATSSTESESTSTETTSTTVESSTIETTSEASTTETSTESSTETTSEASTTETSTESSTEISSTTELSTTTEETTTIEEESTSGSTTTEISSSTSSVSSTTITSTESTSTIETSTSTITYPPGTSISPGPEIPEPGVQCPPMSQTQEKPVFLASTVDCAKYYLCYIGKPVALKCQTGTHFNRYEENCDDPFYAHCQVQGFVDPNPFPQCPRRGIYSFPKMDNCEYFIHCYEGIGSLQKCPFYYGWDVTKEMCIIRDKAVCA